MSTPIGSVTLTVNKPGTFQGAPPMGSKGLIVSNESPFNVAIQLQGTAVGGTLLPETVDFFPIKLGFNGNVQYSPTSVVTNPASYTASTLSFEMVGLNEQLNQSYPLALTRPAVTATASGKPIFTAHFGVGSSAQAVQTLNVFNPPNSGVNMTFHSAKVFTNSSGVPQAVLTYIAGGDLNLATAVNVGSHTASSTPPTSFAHATFDDVAVGHGGVVIDNSRLPGSTSNGTIDLLTFPDTVTLFPGTNLLVVCSDTTSGHVVELLLKWSEDIAIPQQGGVPTGVVMTSIVNTGNAAPTPVVTASPLSEATATLINNDGTSTYGSATRTPAIKFADPGAAAANVLATDSTGTVNLAALLTTKQIGLFVGATKVGHVDSGGIHLDAGIFDTSGSSNTKSILMGNNKPIQSKDSGGTARDVLWVDGSNQTNLQGIPGTDLILFNESNGSNIASAGASGINLSIGSFNPLMAGTSINGSTSGTATLFQPLQGSALKLAIVIFNNFRNGNPGDQILTFPTAFTSNIMGISGASGPFHLRQGGANISVFSQTGFPAAAGNAGTNAGSTVGTNSLNVFHVDGPIDSIGLFGSQPGAVSGMIFFFGV